MRSEERGQVVGLMCFFASLVGLMCFFACLLLIINYANTHYVLTPAWIGTEERSGKEDNAMR